MQKETPNSKIKNSGNIKEKSTSNIPSSEVFKIMKSKFVKISRNKRKVISLFTKKNKTLKIRNKDNLNCDKNEELRYIFQSNYSSLQSDINKILYSKNDLMKRNAQLKTMLIRKKMKNEQLLQRYDLIENESALLEKEFQDLRTKLTKTKLKRSKKDLKNVSFTINISKLKK